MDATTLGAVLACVGVLSGSAVAYIGKRGETRNSLTDQLQEELTAKRTELAALTTELADLQQLRRDYLIRITELEIQIIRLGGTPTP
ncbi:hypothetical protein ACGFY9_13820 [Streptomyces sp. NPDC048504]|uniref:hypothetical protein n=1 Tax=Streptomyces sp. NPDC048504 TaxID=3365559 RepID=UPI003716C858